MYANLLHEMDLHRYLRAHAHVRYWRVFPTGADAGLKKELVARLAEMDGDSQASPELAPRSSPRVPRTMTRSVQRAL